MIWSDKLFCTVYDLYINFYVMKTSIQIYNCAFLSISRFVSFRLCYAIWSKYSLTGLAWRNHHCRLPLFVLTLNLTISRCYFIEQNTGKKCTTRYSACRTCSTIILPQFIKIKTNYPEKFLLLHWSKLKIWFSSTTEVLVKILWSDQVIAKWLDANSFKVKIIAKG